MKREACDNQDIEYAASGFAELHVSRSDNTMTVVCPMCGVSDTWPISPVVKVERLEHDEACALVYSFIETGRVH